MAGAGVGGGGTRDSGKTHWRRYALYARCSDVERKKKKWWGPSRKALWSMALSFFPNHYSSYLLSSSATVRPRRVRFSVLFFFFYHSQIIVFTVLGASGREFSFINFVRFSAKRFVFARSPDSFEYSFNNYPRVPNEKMCALCSPFH